MKHEWNRLLLALALRLARRQQRSTLHLARIRCAEGYVKGVRSVRRGVMAYLGLCLLRFVLGFGLVLLHAGLLLYLPWGLREKGLLLLGLGGIYMIVALAVFCGLLAQRTWMTASRADEAVRRAIRNQPLHETFTRPCADTN